MLISSLRARIPKLYTSAFVVRGGEKASAVLAMVSMLDSGGLNPLVPTGTISYCEGGGALEKLNHNIL